MRFSSTKEADGARHPILAKEQFGFDRRVGVFDIHRQSERDEGGARHLQADHLAAFHRLLNAAIAQWNEIGGVFGPLFVDGYAVGNEGDIELRPVVTLWTRRARYATQPGLLF